MTYKDIDSPFVGSNHARELSFSVASIPVAETVHFPLASACDFVETVSCHRYSFRRGPPRCGLFQFLGCDCSKKNPARDCAESTGNLALICRCWLGGLLYGEAVSLGRNLSEDRCSQARRGRGLRLPARPRRSGSPVAVPAWCPAIQHTLAEASRVRRPHPASAGASSADPQAS